MVASVLLTDHSTAQTLTVEEAYKAIPHRQTTFDPERGELTEIDKQYLQELFGIVDLAMAQRVQTLNWFYTEGQSGSSFDVYEANVQNLISQLDSLEPPKKLKRVHELVKDAVMEQMEYFQGVREEVEEKGSYKFDRNNTLVGQSHRKLINAYNRLVNAFPEAGGHNRQAFFDHLCALDFI